MRNSRPYSVHLALGGGAVAELLLWKKWTRSFLFLAVSTFLWFLFERVGYNLLALISNILLLLVVILFFWAKSASLLKRPLPPLRNLEISKEIVEQVADAMRVLVNHAVSIAHNIAITGNLIRFCQVAIGLWAISTYIGKSVNFLTLLYTGVLLGLSLPMFYSKFQNPIDNKLGVVYKVAQVQYRKLDDKVLSKIPLPNNKAKKIKKTE